MVQSGWLLERHGRYEITAEEWLVIEAGWVKPSEWTANNRD
jgi:hypothetical protein